MSNRQISPNPEVITLSERDTAAPLEAVLNPPRPGPRLQPAAERYAARLRGREGDPYHGNA